MVVPRLSLFDHFLLDLWWNYALFSHLSSDPFSHFLSAAVRHLVCLHPLPPTHTLLVSVSPDLNSIFIRIVHAEAKRVQWNPGYLSAIEIAGLTMRMETAAYCHSCQCLKRCNLCDLRMLVHAWITLSISQHSAYGRYRRNDIRRYCSHLGK